MAHSSETKAAARQAQAEAALHRALQRSLPQAFKYGMLQAIPMMVVIIPFALLFGVVALEAGIDLAQIMGFSILVMAGASQFTVVQLLSDNVPIWLVILSGLTVNLRLAMYSASLVPWLRGTSKGHKAWVAFVLIDQNYALSVQHYERFPGLSLKQKLAHFAGCAATLCITWIFFTWVGGTIGKTIPDDIALDFAIPITFLAMIAPMLRTTAHLVACFVSIIAALIFAGLPSGLGLMVAAPIGMASGALAEVLIERRKGGEQ